MTLPEKLTISARGYCAEIAPGAGCVLLSLQYHSRDLLRPAPSVAAVKDDPREAACFPCVPWFGRLYNGLEFDGKVWPLAPTLPICDPNRALHGYGWVSPWEIISHTEDILLCCFEYLPKDRGFPFAFSAIQKFSLTTGGLKVSLTVENSGAHAMPAGLGLHPYFHRTADTRIEFSSEGFWTPPAGDVPGGVGARPTDLKFSSADALPARMIDHSFTGFGGSVFITNGEIQVAMTCDARNLHLYAPADGTFFCLEPVTNLPGDFAQNILAPGEKMCMKMTIGAFQ